MSNDLLSEQLAQQGERRSPTALVDEERSDATAKKWPLLQWIILFVFVMSVVLWALIILGVRQIF